MGHENERCTSGAGPDDWVDNDWGGDGGGRIAMLGILPDISEVDGSRIVLKIITNKGLYGREIFETWYKMLAM